MNEPHVADINTLSQAYQQWINQARNLGDVHKIVVQNLCSASCPYPSECTTAANCQSADGYPLVLDPLNNVTLSQHTYLEYRFYVTIAPWTNSTADTVATNFYNQVLVGSLALGQPILNTEGGASDGCDVNTPGTCPTDQVFTGSAGYSIVSDRFIQTLTTLYDNHAPKINWVWWGFGALR